ANESATPDQRYEGYTSNRDERPGDDAPDVFLDVPVLNVEELDLEVNDLRAHVSLRAELADLVKINIGVDAYLDKVTLRIKGLEAQAQLKVRLERILGTLERALDAIDNNPQIIGGPAQRTDREERAIQPAEDVGGAAERAGGVPGGVADEAGQEAGALLDETVDGAGRTVQRLVDEAGSITETTLNESGEVMDERVVADLTDLQIEEEYVDDQGRTVERATDGSENVVERTLDEEGNVLDLSVSQEAEDEAENGDTGEVKATDAARRKARELGVRLSEVEGTGSGGRVLVKDVKRAAK
ncbi:MAG: E3 binding domain-containing protein, partial [Actinomycetota bacterium]|nr:E3 binding domain-containing protein [Actinomycetota bacterium]